MTAHAIKFAQDAPNEAAQDASKAELQPYHHDTRGLTLWQGDSLELLSTMESAQFDLIFADPPYFLSNNGVTCQSGRMVSVNKGDWDRSRGPLENHEFNMRWLRECQRLLKPNGSIWVTGTQHVIFSIGFAMQVLGFKMLNDIAWFKVNPPPNLSCRYFTHSTETILWAARDQRARHTFNYDVMKEMNGGKQMKSMWSIQAPRKREKQLGSHPTQKPLELLERILLAATNPGDLVLDPFCGSGTTGVAAASLKRRFVGIDINADYLDLSKRRIAETASQLTLDPAAVQTA
jgi:site-specific DNA-methyltransferase (adenine-specific)